jgi:zinc protease
MRLWTWIVPICMLAAMPAYALVDIDSRTLRGGPLLWVAEDTSLPVVSLQLTFKGGGSASDPQGKEGRAAVATDMLLEGAGTRDALAFKEALAEKAIELSISANSDDMVVRMRMLRAHVPDALKLLGDALVRPRLDPAILERVKREHISALRRYQQRPGYRASARLYAMVFANHPYASNGVGTEASIQALSIEDMRSYQQSFVAPKHAQVAVTGALSMDDARGLFRAFFADMPERSLDHTPAPEAKMTHQSDIVRIAMPVPQSAIRMALPWVSRDHEDFYAAYILQTALGGGVLHSYLGDALRRESGLVYDVGSYLDIREAASIMLIHADTRNSQLDDAITRIRSVLEDVRLNGISQARCEETKQYIIGRLPLMIDSTGGLASILAMMQREGLGEAYLQKRAALFAAVSCESVNRVASELLDARTLSIVVAGGASESTQDAP